MRIPSTLSTMEGLRLVLVGELCLAALLITQHGRGQEVNRDQRADVKLVQALVNRNQQPQIVQASPPIPDILRVPLFPNNYRWDEQQRVKKAICKLRENPTDEVWEKLVQHSDDDRYSITVIDDSENAENLSVGDICKTMAYARLTHVFKQHLPHIKDPCKPQKCISLQIVFGNSLAKWRAQRPKLKLYELQIELCEQAIAQLRKVEGLSQVELQVSMRKIEAEIAELRKTKRSSMVKMYGAIDTYNSDRAAEIRQAHEAEAKNRKE